MTATDARPPESHAFEADVAKLLHLMVHSVYSDKDVFLRELISNGADACERLRYEAIAEPGLLGEDAKPRITLTVDAEERRLTVEDNGIGMSRAELAESLGTIARSGTKAFMDRVEAAQGKDGAQLIGQFGIALPCRGAARICGARFRAGLAPLRPLRHGPQGPHEALCAARLHYR